MSASVDDSRPAVTVDADGDVSVASVGSVGPTGDTGAQGEKGDTGDTGAKGDKGDTGDTGATGATGTGGYSAAYGQLYEEDGGSINLALANTYYPWVTGVASTKEKEWTVSGNALVAGADAAGVYEVTAQCSFTGPNNSTIHGTVWHNGAEVSWIHFERKLSGSGDVGSSSMVGLITVAASDTLTLAFKSLTQTGNLGINHYSLTVRRVGENEFSDLSALNDVDSGLSPNDNDVLTFDAVSGEWGAEAASGGSSVRTFLDDDTRSSVQSATGTHYFVGMADKTKAELETDGWEFDLTSAADPYVENGTGLVIPGGSSGESGMRFTCSQGSANTDFIACFSLIPDRTMIPPDTVRFGVLPTGGSSGHVCEWQVDDTTGWQIEAWQNIGAWPDPGGASMGVLNSHHQVGSEVYLRLIRSGNTTYVCAPIGGMATSPGYVGNLDYANHTITGNHWRIGIWVSNGGVICRWIRRLQ
jgi:hypothetical protein